MPKRVLSKDHFTHQKNSLHQAAKYHWEFKRRSAAYRLWWQQGLRGTIKPEGWDKRFNPDLSFEELVEVSVPCAFKRLLSGIQSARLKRVVDEISEKEKQGIFEYLFLEEMLPKAVECNMGRGSLSIIIHFDKIRSVSALRDYVSHAIDNFYKMFLTHGILSEKMRDKLQKSVNLKRDYNRILDAGDLYEELKKKKSRIIWPYIVEKIYPRSDYPAKYDSYGRRANKKPTESTIKDVKKYVREYQRLVKGGYLEIVYP